MAGIDPEGACSPTEEGRRPPTVRSGERPNLAFFDAERDVVLFCRDGKGRPIGYPMRTVACDRGALVFTTYKKSAKVRHIERDPRVCVLAVRKVQGEVLQWQSVEGRAKVVVPSEEEIERVMGERQPSGGRANEPRVPEGMGDFVRQRLREGKRVFIRVDDVIVTQPGSDAAVVDG